MSSSELLKYIDYPTALRKNRMRAAHWVLAHPDSLLELMDYCFYDSRGELSHKAAWVLEFVCLEDLSMLYPFLDVFFGRLPDVKKDQSVRALAHICEVLAIQHYKKEDPNLTEVFSEKHKTIMIECCLDWLISDQKVACQVRAMTALYYLGTEFDWIHPELKQIIEQHIHSGSAGYKARGRQTLEKIRNWRK